MRTLIKQMNKDEAIDQLDKFTLKFYFKKPSTLNPQIAAEAEKATNMKMAPPNMNVHSLLAEQKNYNINLKDLGGENVFEMQNIVDYILRKVSDCLL